MHGKGDDKLEPKKIPKISGYSGREEELVAPKDFRNNEIAGGRKDKEGTGASCSSRAKFSLTADCTGPKYHFSR